MISAAKAITLSEYRVLASALSDKAPLYHLLISAAKAIRGARRLCPFGGAEPDYRNRSSGVSLRYDPFCRMRKKAHMELPQSAALRLRAETAREAGTIVPKKRSAT